MVITSLQEYWCLVYAYNSGDKSALSCLEIVAMGHGRGALAAQVFLMKHRAEAV